MVEPYASRLGPWGSPKSLALAIAGRCACYELFGFLHNVDEVSAVACLPESYLIPIFFLLRALSNPTPVVSPTQGNS